MCLEISPNRHDDDGGPAWRNSPRVGSGSRGRIAETAWSRDHLWIDIQPDAHPVHDAGSLPLPRPPRAAIACTFQKTLGRSGRMSLSKGSANVIALLVLFITVSSCAVGPKYKRPPAP